MKDGRTSYELPTETLPVLELPHHIEDLLEVQEFLEERGIPTKNTRIEKYVRYLQQVAEHGTIDESLIFKDSSAGPFRSPIDWYLYVLREVHELMWILKGLRVRSPVGVDRKLQIIVGGSEFAALDTNSRSRNTQFELRIASYFCQAGCNVDLSTETDIIALTDRQAFYLECKRIASRNQLHKRLAEARSQLNDRMPARHGRRTVYGCIAADVTKAAFAHNGLTMGQTYEHGREVVQEKLIDLANESETQPLFRDCPQLYQYWLQIHIPSLIITPPTTSTRFSSFFLNRGRLKRKERKAYRAFDKIFKAASKGDSRGTPPRKLTPRMSITIPKGSTFRLDDELLAEFLRGGAVNERPDEEVIAELSINNVCHEFFFHDFQVIIANISNAEKEMLVKDPNSARVVLVGAMLARRFPYEEMGPDGL